MYFGKRKLFDCLQTIGIWLNLFPHYVQTDVVECRWCKLNAMIKVIVVSIFLCLRSPSILDQLRAGGWHGIVLQMIVNWLTVGFLIVGTIKAAFGDIKIWSNFFDTMKYALYFCQPKRMRVDGLSILCGVMHFLVMAAVSIIMIFARYQEKHWQFSLYWISFHFSHLYQILFTDLIIWNTMVIKKLYKELNIFLLSIKAEKSDKGKLFQINKKVPIDCITKTSKVYRMMFDLVENWNYVNGWQLLIIFFNFALSFLIVGNFLTRKVFAVVKGETAASNTDNIVGLCSAIIVSSSMVTCVVISMVCDFACKESRKTVKLCYKLQKDFPLDSVERRELLKLAKLCEKNLPKFSAAGFFEVDRKTLFTIFSTITTYFIVILQFNAAEI